MFPHRSRQPASDRWNSEPREESPLRICMLAPTPFPANQGTPGSIREMAEAVAERGHDVHIVTYQLGEDIAVQGPQLHRIGSLFREASIFVGPTARRPLYDLQMVFKTLQVMRRHPPDLIHAHGYEAALIGWWCRMITGVPMIYSGHNTMADELPSYRFIRPQWLARTLARLLDAFVPRLADRCLPHSVNMEEFFRGMGLAGRTEPIVPFGIDLKMRSQGDTTLLRRRYGLGQGPVVLYAGLLDEFQRLDLLLEAMPMVVAREPEARLLLVVTIPNDKHQAAIRAHAARLGIADRLIMTEPQSLNAVREFLALGDVAVVPRPRVPGFPIKLLNYMAARKPCVLYASSANRLSHGDNACLASPDTSAALGDAILEVLEDRQLRLRLARNGFQFVRQHHDRRLMAQQVCAAYRHTLELTQHAPRLPQPASTIARPVHLGFPTVRETTKGREGFSPRGMSTGIVCEVGS